MPRICVFDVNETLLDLSGLDAFFVDVFGDAAVRREWFTQVIQSALTTPAGHGLRPTRAAARSCRHGPARRRLSNSGSGRCPAATHWWSARPPRPNPLSPYCQLPLPPVSSSVGASGGGGGRPPKAVGFPPGADCEASPRIAAAPGGMAQLGPARKGVGVRDLS